MAFIVADKIPQALRSRVGLALFGFVGVAISLAIAQATKVAETDAMALEFERRQTLRHAFLQQSLGAYENSLFALRLVAENNVLFTPQEFARAAHAIHARSSGIQAVQWAPIVTTSAIPDFLTQARRLIEPDFTIRKLADDGSLQRYEPDTSASGPGTHAVISYVYPRSGNEGALGYDVFTAPSAPALNRARSTQELTLTKPIRLIQGYEGVMFLSYVQRDAHPEGPPLSGSGYVQLVLNLNQVLHNLWNLSPSNVADFALYDISEQEPVALYTQYANRAESETSAVPFSDFVNERTLYRELLLGGRIWRACYRPHADWIAQRNSGIPGVILCGGLLLTVLGVAYLRLLLRRNEAIHREVTARTRELSESRAFLETVIRQSPSTIWVKDHSLRFRLVNAEFCKTYNRTAEEIIGRTDDDLLPADRVAEVQAIDREVLTTGETRQFESTYRLGDRNRTFIVAKFPLRNPEDNTIHGVAGVATDITERRLAEAERIAMERRLLETQKLESLGVLAGGIAHDFNNLLTGVLGHASLCRAQLSPLAPQQASLAQIEQAARRAAEICQQMLAYAGRGRFAVELVELGSLVRDALPLLRLSVSKNAHFLFDLPLQLPSVEGDRAQLRQLILNLVMNASESFGPATGEITLRTRLVPGDTRLFAGCIHAPERSSGDYLCLEVSDNGPGISVEAQRLIFDPFFTTKFAGRGLGLAAALGIIRGHEGAIRVVSEPGKGSTFFIYLPAKAVVAPVPDTSSTAAPELPLPATCRLLLVDDETSVRDTAAAILHTFGYEVDTVQSGEDALDRFRADPHRYHAALLDVTMPGLSGPALLEAMRKIRPELPVLLMSGYNQDAVAPFLNAPRLGFLPKPFTVDALRAQLGALLRG